MAKINVGKGFSINMVGLDLSNIYYGVNYVRGGTSFIVQDENGDFVDFRGKDFKYNSDGEPIGGMVDSYAATFNNQRAVTVIGLHIAVSDLRAAAHTFSTNDDQALVAQMFAKNDRLTGANKGDGLYGFAGDDKLIGRADADVLFGGTGADTFYYNSVSDSTQAKYDAIGDFSIKGHDIIDLVHVDANGSGAGNGEFSFIGAAAFSGVAGELQVTFINGNTAVMGDVDGDGTADLVIGLVGEIALTKDNFHL